MSGFTTACETVKEIAARAICSFAAAVNRPLLVCRLALIAYPLGMVWLYLPQFPVPHTVDVEIAKAVRTALRRPSMNQPSNPTPRGSPC